MQSNLSEIAIENKYNFKVNVFPTLIDGIIGVAYYRFSSSNQHEESIEEQQEVVREYAKKNGITIIKEYIDRAETATSDDRPNFQVMTSEILSDIVRPNVLLTHKTNRFARNSYDAVVYKHELAKKNVKVIAVTQPIGDGPEGIILERLYEALDEYYSANLSVEVKTKMKQHAKKAKHLGGLPPLGYDVFFDGEAKRYRINESEAGTVKIIFSMYLSGKSYPQIISYLKQCGYKTKVGKEFLQTSIYEILRNEKYTGTYVYNKTISKTNGKRNNHAEKKENEIIKIPNAIPAIITQEQFEEVKEMMSKRKQAPAATKAKEIYLLTGLIYCGRCGGPMVGNRAKQGRNKEIHAYYECNTRKRTKTCDAKSINKKYIESLVIDELSKQVFSQENMTILVEKLNKSYNEKLKRNQFQFEKSKEELKNVNKKIYNMIKAISDGFYSPSMKSTMTELEQQKELLLSTIASYERKATYKITEQIVWECVKKDKKTIESDDLQAKKSILAGYIKHIYVFEDAIEIDFSLDFNGGGGGS
jgi:site-specific DNA recombinase